MKDTWTLRSPTIHLRYARARLSEACYSYTISFHWVMQCPKFNSRLFPPTLRWYKKGQEFSLTENAATEFLLNQTWQRGPLQPRLVQQGKTDTSWCISPNKEFTTRIIFSSVSSVIKFHLQLPQDFRASDALTYIILSNYTMNYYWSEPGCG